MAMMAIAGAGMTACSESQSYSELLRDEEKAVNWYLAQQKVELEIPSDSISFKTGEDAPFYKLDEDGYVYMQVINKGDLDADGKATNRVESGDEVYFRFLRSNIKDMYDGLTVTPAGNANSVLSGANYFIYKNTYLQASTQYGTGIQEPMKFFGYNCEVNLIVKSVSGFATDQSYCYPYLINIRYFKPEY